MMSQTTILLGVQVARTLLTGDVSAARKLAATNRWGTAWTVPEARAITGACREANRRWGCNLNAQAILGWS